MEWRDRYSWRHGYGDHRATTLKLQGAVLGCSVGHVPASLRLSTRTGESRSLFARMDRTKGHVGTKPQGGLARRATARDTQATQRARVRAALPHGPAEQDRPRSPNQRPRDPAEHRKTGSRNASQFSVVRSSHRCVVPSGVLVARSFVVRVFHRPSAVPGVRLLH